MKWLLWRQQRLVFLSLGVIDIVVSFWAWHASRAYVQGVRLHCLEFGNTLSFRSNSPLCLTLDSFRNSVDGSLNDNSAAAMIFCVLAGVIAAIAVIVTEFDRSTIRVSWSQSQTRTRWFMWEWMGGAIATIVLATPLALILGYWPAVTRLNGGGVTSSGGMLVVYGLLAFSLTSLVGILIRRSGWTIAVSIALMLGIWLGVSNVNRSFLMTPTATYALDMNSNFSPPISSLELNYGRAPYHPGTIPSDSLLSSATTKWATCYLGKDNGATKTDAQIRQGQLSCWKKLDLAQVWIYVSPTELPRLLREDIAGLVGLALLTGLVSGSVVRRMSV
jgi:ABC-type transport system involved in multi-copper enzyme maturation permease subunit